MFVAVGRGRKDAKALGHALNVESVSLGGVRSAEEADLSKLPEGIPVFFFGREDVKMVRRIEERIAELFPIYQIVILRKKKVRNARMEELRECFEMARAKIRLGMRFTDVFEFSSKNEMRLEIHPDYDTYFLLGNASVERTREIFGVDVEEGALVLRCLMNEERIYVPELKAILSKKIGEDPSVVYKSDVTPRKIDPEKMVERNREFLKALERVSIKFVEKNAEGEVGVPFSGGKDSLASLILAKKALGDVKAIYVRTSHDMPQTEEYVGYVCRKLGVDLIIADAKFDLSSNPMPTNQNRWCTAVKLEALKKAVEEEGIDTLIAGDRDGESRARRKRDFVLWRVAKEIFPIKHWSGAMVQLYDMMNGFRLHPLYYEGFYRLGCTICPSLSSWEKLLLHIVHKV